MPLLPDDVELYDRLDAARREGTQGVVAHAEALVLRARELLLARSRLPATELV